MSDETREIDITEAKDGGVLKTVLKEGTGPGPMNGDTAFVHYIGRFENGEEFDSSHKTNQPFSFKVGAGQVIKGWDLVLPTMRLQEKALVKVSPEYGYGAAGSPPKIPPNTTLFFEITLLKHHGEDISPDGDGTIYRNVIVPGEKYKSAGEFAQVKVHAIGQHDGEVFYDRDLEYVLGEGSLHDLPDGVDKSLRRFCKGEKSKVLLTDKWSYGAQAPFKLPPHPKVEFTLFLKDFDDKKHLWEMDTDEKLAGAEELKTKGNEFLAKTHYKIALDKYRAAASMLEADRNVKDEDKQKWQSVRVACLTNGAFVHLRTNEPGEAIRMCEQALALDPNNVKAIYRTAEAHYMRKDFEDAIKTYKRVLELEPSNASAAKKIKECKAKVDEQRNIEKRRYANMFKRMEEVDKAQ